MRAIQTYSASNKPRAAAIRQAFAFQAVQTIPERPLLDKKCPVELRQADRSEVALATERSERRRDPPRSCGRLPAGGQAIPSPQSTVIDADRKRRVDFRDHN